MCKKGKKVIVAILCMMLMLSSISVVQAAGTSSWYKQTIHQNIYFGQTKVMYTKSK